MVWEGDVGFDDDDDDDDDVAPDSIGRRTLGG